MVKKGKMMVKKCFLIILISTFLLAVMPKTGYCGEETNNVLKAVGLITFLLFMGEYVFPYYGNNTAQIVVKSGWKTYKYPQYTDVKTF